MSISKPFSEMNKHPNDGRELWQSFTSLHRQSFVSSDPRFSKHQTTKKQKKQAHLNFC